MVKVRVMDSKRQRVYFKSIQKSGDSTALICNTILSGKPQLMQADLQSSRLRTARSRIDYNNVVHTVGGKCTKKIKTNSNVQRDNMRLFLNMYTI